MKKHMKDMRKLTLRKESIQQLGIDLAKVDGGIQRPATYDCTTNYPYGCSTAC
jgi:hypothetical protein